MSSALPKVTSPQLPFAAQAGTWSPMTWSKVPGWVASRRIIARPANALLAVEQDGTTSDSQYGYAPRRVVPPTLWWTPSLQKPTSETLFRTQQLGGGKLARRLGGRRWGSR